MNRILSPAFALLITTSALAGGNRPLNLPPHEPNLPGDVGPTLDAARKQYESTDDAQRRIAVGMYETIHHPSADLYIMMIAYEDPHPAVRLSAVEALFHREHPKAPLLAARLSTSCAPKKYLDAGAHLVWKSGSKEAVALIIEAMRKGSAGFDPVHKVGPDPGAVNWGPLLDRTLCARALGRIATREAVDALIEALRYPEWEMRSTAAQALGESGDAAAVRPLLRAVEDKDLDVQCEAMLALGRLGGAEATAFLQKAAKRETSERETHFETEYWRNEIYVRIAARALKAALAPRAAAPPAPAGAQPGGKKVGPAGAGGRDTSAQEPERPPESQQPVEEERKAPPEVERDEAGEDLLYVCDTTGTMTSAKDCINKLVEERLLYRDLASDFRFGFVAFRDYGNQYMTKELFFTRDFAKVRDFMMHLGFSGANPGEGSAAEKALQVATMLDWSRVPRKRLVLISDTLPNDEEELYFRGRLIHDEENVVINTLFHTHAATKKVVLQKLAKIGGGHSDFLPCDKAAGRPRDAAELR